MGNYYTRFIPCATRKCFKKLMVIVSIHLDYIRPKRFKLVIQRFQPQSIGYCIEALQLVIVDYGYKIIELVMGCKNKCLPV